MTLEVGEMEKAIDNEEITFKKRLSYDKLSFYYISLPIIILGEILGALLLSALQMNVIDLYPIGIWLSLNIIMFLYQVYQYYRFKNETEENKLKEVNIWLDRYYTNVLINGIIWGSSALLIFPHDQIMNQMIVMLFLFAIGFSSMGVLASKQDLLLTYVLVTYSPLILRLFFLEDEIYTKIAYAVLALMLIMILISNYYGKVINNALNNRQYFITIKHTHERLKERFFSLFERAPVGIYYYNENLELEDINAHFMKMNKIEEKKNLVGINLNALSSQAIIKVHNEVFKGKTGNYKGPFESINNETLYVKLSTVPMINAEGKVAGGISIINDITSEVTAKEKMIRNAYYDLLTNIPNRTLLMDKLKAFVSEKKEHDTYAGILFLDIDNFKKVNDTYGHDVGDKLLKQVVQRIEDIVQSYEIFARVSGNKFVILVPALDENENKAKKLILEYISMINKHFEQPLNVIGQEYHVSFTIGIVIFKNQDATAFDLLKRAETAMYKAKKNAKGTSAFYESEMSVFIKEQLMLENDIHNAMKNNELTMYYQPQMDIKHNKIIGAEALIRWEHPTLGFVPPSKFIPIIEESGMIMKLEEWIFNQVLSEVKKIEKEKNGFILGHIAINVSTIHFLQPHFVDQLMLLVNEYKVKPEWIELEITESGIMGNIDDAIVKINELKGFGFTFSIDDFGTGYSSLAYLKKLPVDIIKIDQSFIMHMRENKGDALIVESVVAIGNKFDLKVLAEGVENSETLDHLKMIECDFYQGNFGFRPMPIDDFIEII